MSMNYRLLKWFASGVVFASAVCAAGCSLLPGPRQQAVHAPPPPAPVQPAPAGEPAAASAPTSAVNIFGEFDGIQRHAAPAAAEAGFQQHTACDEGYDADVAVDPTGKWLAFTSTRHSEQPDIYMQRADGASVIQLTSDPAADAQPAFSPDGKRLAFCSTRSGNWDIYLMDADGRNVEQLTSTAAQEIHPSFSPDGTRLAYCALSPRSDQWELWILDLDTRAKRVIGQGLFPAWCPDKSVDRIAFQRARQRGSRWFSVWTVDLVNGEPTRLTEVAVSSNAAVVSPAWSPDGARIVFSTIPQPDASAHPAAQDVWVASADGSARRRLTNGDCANLGPIWAPDNRVYFVSNRGGNENVWSVQVEPAATASANHKSSTPSAPPAVGSADQNPATR